MPLAVDTAFAGYTVLRLLGSGGMGEVYLVQHPRLPRRDALKVLRADISADSDYRQRFAREAELAAKLWHQNIVSVHDCGDDDGRLWISMRYVDGTDAGRLLQDRYPTGMPLSTVIEIVSSVAAALDYAHAQGVLHRDVKPSNIFIAQPEDGQQRMLLGDFGIARDLGDSSGLTVTNTAVGTVAYAAPEQLVGRPVDGRADQYELAATAYHLLTGTLLYPYSNPAVVIGQHLTAQPPSLADTRPELAPLDAVLRKALAKNPADRFGSCTEFARALANATAMPPPTYPTYPLPAPAPAPTRWPSLLAAVALAVAVCVAAYVGIKVINRSPAPPQQFALTGTVHLPGDNVTTSGLPAAYRCAGAEGLGDVTPGASVTVADDAGKLLAKGSLESSYLASGSCNMSFTIDNVPSGANFYRVQVARQGEFSFTESEAEAGVDITLGSSGSTTTSSTPRSTTRTSTTANADQAALGRLQETAVNDRSSVPVDRWVAQLSSKRPGTQDDGIVYDYPAIWNHYVGLRQKYAQRSIDLALLWSGDWSTFDGRDYWVIITAGTFLTPEDALAWCRSEGYPWDDCFAKLVSTTHPVDGSTKYNPH